MIIESLLDLTFWFIGLLFEGLQIISIPTNLLGVLVNFMRFGAWVLGADLLGIVFSSILFWLSFKFSAGLILFIWRLLPLT